MSLAIYGYELRTSDAQTARTHLFSFLVFAELFRSFASRSESRTFFHLGPVSNVYHLGAVAIPIAFQFLLHHFVIFQEVFKVKSVGWQECGILLALALVPVTLIEIAKLTRERKRDPV
jgi:Ca2+-transporting ATPase